MRIISGRYKGRVIVFPEQIRPTGGLVRGAIFNILGDIEGLSFLELFAGSGAVGIEALSRGAGYAVFVENSPNCLKALENNSTWLVPGTYSLLRLEASIALKRLSEDRKKFDIIFIDPPYHKGISKKILQMLGAYDILARNGFVAAQHFKKEDLPQESGDLVLVKEYRYGNTVLSFYRKA